MTNDGDTFALASGRKFYAHAGIIGIDAKGQAYHGHGGELPTWESDADRDTDLTPDERLEIAQVMILRWAKWGAE